MKAFLINRGGASESKHINYISYLRIVSSFAVVLIHVVYQAYLDFPDSSDTSYLYVFNFLCFAVPCFVMITGKLLLEPEKKYNLQKSLMRVVLPLFVYGYIFSLMELVLNARGFYLNMLIEAFICVLLRKSWAHLWYLYMIIGLYLIIPFLKILVNKLTKEYMTYLFALLFIFNSVFIDINRIFNITIPFTLPINGIFILYLLLGYYLSKFFINNKTLITSWCLCALLIILCSWKGIRFDSIGYNDIPVVWLSINVYMSFLKLEKHAKCSKLVLLIDANCFGIYIIHMVFVNFIYKVLNFNPYNYQPLAVWLFLSITIFILSFCYSVIVKKIPVINKIFFV